MLRLLSVAGLRRRSLCVSHQRDSVTHVNKRIYVVSRGVPLVRSLSVRNLCQFCRNHLTPHCCRSPLWMQFMLLPIVPAALGNVNLACAAWCANRAPTPTHSGRNPLRYPPGREARIWTCNQVLVVCKGDAGEVPVPPGPGKSLRCRGKLALRFHPPQP